MKADAFNKKLFLFVVDKSISVCYKESRCGGVAQLVRASACHAEGREFKSLRSRHLMFQALWSFPRQAKIRKTEKLYLYCA